MVEHKDFSFNLPFRLRLPDGRYDVMLKTGEVVQLILEERIPNKYDDRMGIRGLTHDDLVGVSSVHLMSLENEVKDGKRTIDTTPDRVWHISDLAKVNFVVKNNDNTGFEHPVVINAEFPYDRLGRFRYTKVTLHYDSGEPLHIAVEAVNKLIEYYRIFAGEHWVQRIREDDIKMYEADDGKQKGYSGFIKRVPNLQDDTISAIKRFIIRNDPPLTYYLLYLDAENALNEEEYRLAIIYSIMALESLVKTFLGNYFKEYELREQCSTRLLDELSLYYLMMNIVRPILGLEMDESLWKKFVRVDERRNKVVHNAASVTKGHAREAVKMADQFITIFLKKRGGELS